jgi:hypothetical protein
MSCSNENLKLDNFSVENLFFIIVKPHLVSFRVNSLPKDIHFTIGFDERKTDFNFHITKNVPDPNNKPKLEIVLIDKKLFENAFPEIRLNIIKFLLEPISIDELKEKYNNDVGFLSFDKLEKFKDYSLSNLFESFKENIEIIRNKKLKIKRDIEESFLNFVIDEKKQDDLLNHIEDLLIDFNKPTDGGIILTRDKAIHVIRITDNWYSLNLNFKPIDFLKLIIESDLAEQLVDKVKKEIEIIKTCNTYADSQIHNNPIRLIWQEGENIQKI